MDMRIGARRGFETPRTSISSTRRPWRTAACRLCAQGIDEAGGNIGASGVINNAGAARVVNGFRHWIPPER